MKKVALIISVSPFEPKDVVLKSIEWMKSLDYEGIYPRIFYVMDFENEELREILEKKGVEVVVRGSRRGRKAGAINYCLDHVFRTFKPDYIAFFDVDSRPSKKFLIKCVDGVESGRKVFIASTERRALNPSNLISEVISFECTVFNFFLRRSDFKNFNGLIGVLKSRFLEKERFDEGSFSEDLEFSVRMHAKGYESIFVEGEFIEEQPVFTWRDLYVQRRRWYFGAFQLTRKSFLWKSGFFLAKILPLILLANFLIFLIPLAIFSFIPLIILFRNFKKSRIAVGFVLYLVVNQLASLSALYRFLRGREVEWLGIRRAKM